MAAEVLVLQRVEAIFAQYLGIAPGLFSVRQAVHAVEQRSAACGLDCTNAYLQRLGASPTELQELAAHLLVPETWFFRDGKPFQYCVQHAASTWRPTRSARPLRVLSVPCATGEEPYSLAMALECAGFGAERVGIDAIDYCPRYLAAARRGVYHDHSFRSADLGFRHRFFVPTDRGYKLQAAIRRRVRFYQGNLLHGLPLGVSGPYDMIFCRNLLIYLTPQARQQVRRVLLRLLYEDGLLFVGSSEVAAVEGHGLKSLRQPNTFVFQKEPGPKAFKEQPAAGSTPPEEPNKASPSARPGCFAPAASTTAGRPQNGWLKLARQRADQGDLAAARQLCQTRLRHERTDPQAYTLLGLIAQAAGQLAEAEGHFSRAIYLDPEAHEALVHLALLAESHGDQGKADLLKKRAARRVPRHTE